MYLESLGYELLFKRSTAKIYVNRQNKTVIKCSKPGQVAVQHEIVFLMNLDHPSIIKPISFDMENGILELPYMESGDLLDLLDDCVCLCKEETKLIMTDLLRAVEYLAENGIAHLDIKPDNILIADNGRPLLFDFGLAEFVDTGQTAHGGTTGYAAPEVLQASSNVRKADVWSLGVVMYACLYGSLPFSEEEVLLGEDYCNWKLRTEVANDDDLACDLLVKMLAFDPNKRISAEEALQHPWLSGV